MQTYTRPAGGAVSAMPFASYAGATSYAAPATYTGATSYATPSVMTMGMPATTYTSQAAPTFSTFASQSLASQPIQTIASQPQIQYSMPVTTTMASSRPSMLGTTTMQYQQPQVMMTGGATVAATYLGGAAVTTQSAQLLAAGRVVSERIVSMEECYNTGLVRTEAMPVTEVVQMQPVVETIVRPDGQVELVQAEMVTDTVVTAEGQVLQEQVLVEGGAVVADSGVQELEPQPGPPRVVIVCTSADQMVDQPTGAWSEEITGPYYVFTEAGCEVYVASIMGGKVPIDQGSLSENFLTENDRRFSEEGCLQFLDNSYAIGDVSAEAIDCVWLAGGHGTCMDFEPNLAQFVTDAHALGRPIGAVCHGVCGLLSAIAQDGTPLLAGKQVTGFSNAEEEQVGLAGVVPFLVQNRMEELGASYSCGEPWTEYAIRDGKVITGQNPQSSVRTAQLCVEAMMQP